MKKKKLISAIRKAIREKDITLACKLIPAKFFSAKFGWVRDNISKERAIKLEELALNVRLNRARNKFKTKVINWENISKQRAFDMLKILIKEKLSPYSKIAMYGHTHLYFCSPVYKHNDYNKVQCCKIKGNENFCFKIIELSNRIYNKKGGNL